MVFVTVNGKLAVNPILLGGIPPPSSYIKQDYSQTGRTFVNPSEVCEQIFLAHILAILLFLKVGHHSRFKMAIFGSELSEIQVSFFRKLPCYKT